MHIHGSICSIGGIELKGEADHKHVTRMVATGHQLMYQTCDVAQQSNHLGIAGMMVKLWSRSNASG